MFHALAGLGRFRAVDEAAPQRDIFRAVEQEHFGRQPVAAGATGLLIVGLDAGGHVHMQHEAYIGLVDAHAESDGGDHDQALLMLEAALVRFARVHAPCRRGRIARCRHGH